VSAVRSAQVPVSLEVICTATAQTELVNRLRRGDPDEYWLMLNPLRPTSDVGELATALRFALLIQETGKRSIVARAGYLRRLVLRGAKTLFRARDHPDLEAEPSADAPHG
jgi:hypothetical protein